MALPVFFFFAASRLLQIWRWPCQSFSFSRLHGCSKFGDGLASLFLFRGFTAAPNLAMALPVFFFFAASLCFLLTIFPRLFLTKSDFLSPPTVFSLFPLNTELFARFPLAILLTFIALRLFIVLFFFILFMAFIERFIAFIAIFGLLCFSLLETE